MVTKWLHLRACTYIVRLCGTELGKNVMVKSTAATGCKGHRYWQTMTMEPPVMYSGMQVVMHARFVSAHAD